MTGTITMLLEEVDMSDPGCNDATPCGDQVLNAGMLVLQFINILFKCSGCYDYVCSHMIIITIITTFAFGDARAFPPNDDLGHPQINISRL